MINDTLNVSSLASLILRIALAVIFIYHGLEKITGRNNDAGASWAVQLWEREGKPPQEVLDKLDNLSGMSTAQIAEIREKLKSAYSHESGIMPVGLRYAVTQLLVAYGEVVGGIALLVGLLTRLSAAAMIIIQVGAVATVTWFKGFSPEVGVGYEYNLALLAMLLAVIFLGGGMLSVDYCLRARRRQRRAALAPAGAV